MKRTESLRMALQVAGFLFIVVLVAPPSALSATVFYLDPDVSGGTHVGTQANPFNTLGTAEWAIVNNALALDNVTVYCSARNAGTDTNQIWNYLIDITRKTPAPPFTLTFDGRSQWNSNDATPNWSAYSGTSRCQIAGVTSENSAHTKYNDVTIDGFVIIMQGPSAGLGSIVSICGDNWTVQNNDISFSSGTTTSPAVLLVPTADAAHEGTDSFCGVMSNVNILNNTLHDTNAEVIYIGGGGCRITATSLDQANFNVANGACQGAPAHSNITIKGNVLKNCGSSGPGATACITIKAAISNLTITQNDISSVAVGTSLQELIDLQGTTTPNSGGGLTTVNQNIVIERNYFHDGPHAASSGFAGVALASFWGTSNGVVIRNNIFANIAQAGRSVDCFQIYDVQPQNGAQLYNNTFYNCAGGAAITLVSGSGGDYHGPVTIENNTILNTQGTDTSFGWAPTADHNAYDGTWSGSSCTSCVSGLTSAAFTNVTAENFTLPSSSILIKAGVTIPTFSNDYLNNTRPPGLWDIGAYQFTPATHAPSPPQQLRVN